MQYTEHVHKYAGKMITGRTAGDYMTINIEFSLKNILRLMSGYERLRAEFNVSVMRP